MSQCITSYNNYGSYLRSRGIDREICILKNRIDQLEQNDLTNGGTINGDLIITGTLTVGTTSTIITTDSLNVKNYFIIDDQKGHLELDISMNGTFNLDGPLNINGITTLNNSLITPSLKVNNNNIILDCSFVDFSNNIVIYKNKDNIRQGNIFSETITIINIKNFSIGINDDTTLDFIICDLSGTSNDYIEYSNALNPTSIFTKGIGDDFIIDVFSNQEYFKDCVVEIYVNCNIELVGNQDVDYTLYSFKSTDGLIEFVIDTRSFGKRSSKINVTYGPYTFITTSKYYSILNKKYYLLFEGKTVSGVDVLNVSDIKLVFKQKFI